MEIRRDDYRDNLNKIISVLIVSLLLAITTVGLSMRREPLPIAATDEISLNPTLYSPNNESIIMADKELPKQFPVSPDKIISGGNGFFLRTFYKDAILPKRDFANPCWPLKISQGFKQSHPAIDITGIYKSPIYSMDNGIIEKAIFNNQYNGGFGNHLIVDFGSGFKALYAHLSEVYVKDGEIVKRGQIIAGMGNTGRVIPAPTASHPLNAVHLHIELQFFNEYINPLRYFSDNI